MEKRKSRAGMVGAQPSPFFRVKVLPSPQLLELLLAANVRAAPLTRNCSQPLGISSPKGIFFQGAAQEKCLDDLAHSFTLRAIPARKLPRRLVEPQWQPCWMPASLSF